QLPQVNADFNAQRGRVFQGGDYITGQLFAADATVSFEIDLWGRLASLSDAARSNLLATEYARDGVTSSLVGDTATAYFDRISLARPRTCASPRQRCIQRSRSPARSVGKASICPSSSPDQRKCGRWGSMFCNR